VTPADLTFATLCVRALNMIAQAAKEWVKTKALEMAPKRENDDDDPQS